MLKIRLIVAVALPVLSLVAAIPEARAACNPKPGRRGSFPSQGDTDIPINAHFVFELSSWPSEPTGAGLTLSQAGRDIPGTFKLLYPLGPVGAAHSQYVYEFIPGNIPETQSTLTYSLSFTPAGVPKETHTAAFSISPQMDSTPPAFTGVGELRTIYGSPDNPTSGPGYDCLLGAGTFITALMKVPPPSAAERAAQMPRYDGIIFTAYESTESGVVGKVMARSAIWPPEYSPPPADWAFIVEVDPAPDAKRCFVIRATDAVGNEDLNTNVKCIVAPGPAALPPGSGAPGFFGSTGSPPVCAYARGSRPGPFAFGGVVAAMVGLAARARRRCRR